MPLELQEDHGHEEYRPPHLVLQWHITERCNFRCAHCYQDTYNGGELPFQDLLVILTQFTDLLDRWDRRTGSSRVRAHINVTGGEPFIRPDFLDLLAAFAEKRDRLTFGILTNGSLIDADLARRLRGLGPAYVQVSVEGTEETNDRIRGPAAHGRAVRALQALAQEGIPTTISFTAQRSNFREFPAVARLGRDLRATRVWADRVIPAGNGAALAEQMLSPTETREFFEIMYQAHGEAVRGFCRTEIAMMRALQFLVGGGIPYRCGAGDTLVTVQPNGDLYPCRRMPIRVGSVLERPLAELYYTSDLFLALRDRGRVPAGCRSCRYVRECRGGLRCLAYAMHGDPFTPDPGCWRTTPAGVA
jgi:radical SAM protein with 4Fe4S-binding SPASM domain